MEKSFLVRGKNIADKSEWVVGYYIKKGGDDFISPLDRKDTFVKVQHDTICKCTGLYDTKTNELVFDSDVIDFESEDGEEVHGGLILDSFINEDNNGCLHVLESEDTDDVFFYGDFSDGCTINVLGNIIDNQELFYKKKQTQGGN